jgi:hypothetical protein
MLKTELNPSGMNMKGIDTLSLSDVKKKELILAAFKVLHDLPMTAIKGNQSLAQEIMNRIESMNLKFDEFQYVVNAVTILIDRSKGKEIEIVYKGQVMTREKLAKEFGIFLAPSQKLQEDKLKMEFNKMNPNQRIDF